MTFSLVQNTHIETLEPEKNDDEVQDVEMDDDEEGFASSKLTSPGDVIASSAYMQWVDLAALYNA